MSKDRLLREYRNSIHKLQRDSLNAGISKEEFEKMYFENIKSLTKEVKSSNVAKTRMIYFLLSLSCVAAILLSYYNYRKVYSCFICNVQDYIYPGLRLLRKVTIPIISLFPSLTELYQETCLLQNPFFTVVDMDCWPCSTVNNIGEVNNPQPVHQQHNAPFIYKTEQAKLNLDSLKSLYMEHNRNLHNDDQNLIDNKHNTQQGIFSTEKNLFIWKINNIEEARALRKLIPRPKVVPKFGQSIERFIIIDSNQGMFHIPDTECNYSFLLATNGNRIIQLKPAEECKYQCKSLKLELKESYLLWYNWWYWRPIVQPSSSNKTFIAHVGSYC